MEMLRVSASKDGPRRGHRGAAPTGIHYVRPGTRRGKTQAKSISAPYFIDIWVGRSPKDDEEMRGSMYRKIIV